VGLGGNTVAEIDKNQSDYSKLQLKVETATFSMFQIGYYPNIK